MKTKKEENKSRKLSKQNDGICRSGKKRQVRVEKNGGITRTCKSNE
jgi:hypothetical protein